MFLLMSFDIFVYLPNYVVCLDLELGLQYEFV